MTREEAIRYLERHGFIDDEVKDMCIEALATSTNVGSKWIPCSERLPDVENEMYLACDEKGILCMPFWCDGWNCSRDFDGKVNRTYEMHDIIAWQSLPEPYKGE